LPPIVLQLARGRKSTLFNCPIFGGHYLYFSCFLMILCICFHFFLKLFRYLVNLRDTEVFFREQDTEGVQHLGINGTCLRPVPQYLCEAQWYVGQHRHRFQGRADHQEWKNTPSSPVCRGSTRTGRPVECNYPGDNDNVHTVA